MKKNVSIARALKEKNRIAGRLRQALEEVGKENAQDVRIPRGIDVLEMYEQAKQLRARLLATKRAIAEANHAIVGKILELDEVKAQIAFLNGLNVKEGRFVTTRYSETIETEVTAVIQKAQVLKEVEALQKQADALQDELDTFNATTFVEIEVD